MSIKYRWAVLVLALCFSLNATSSDAMRSTSYKVIKSVISGGGLSGGSANYLTSTSIAQPGTIGKISSVSYTAYSGYWHQKILVQTDTDGDGLPDELEKTGCTDWQDADTDDDGILDGDEDVNHNGAIDADETDPCDVDSDNDGIQDGTELGYTLADVDSDTVLGVFIPDEDDTTTTDPTNDDTDGDGVKDGDEDTNHNGRVDPGETDPDDRNSIPKSGTLFFPVQTKDGKTAIIYLD
jgi:hypothetical protein